VSLSSRCCRGPARAARVGLRKGGAQFTPQPPRQPSHPPPHIQPARPMPAEVYKMLKLWGQDDVMCRAGLMHSAYSK